MKKILVCVKMVPVDFNAGLDSQFHVQRNKTGLQLNVADMAAVEAALSCPLEKEVTILSMGLKKSEDVLKDLLIRGADRAILINDKRMAGADTFATAQVLKAAVRKLGDFALIICGRRAVDGETGQIPGELAAALEVPCISNVNDIRTGEETVIFKKILENGTEEAETGYPAILSVCEYSYRLRLPGIRQMRAAAEKKVEIWSSQELGLSEEQYGQKGSLTKVLKTARIDTGLRMGPKERDPEKGARRLMEMIREVSV